MATLRRVVQNYRTLSCLSHNNPRLRRYLSSDYFRLQETKPAEKSQLKSFTFSPLLVYMVEKITPFVESTDSDIRKLVTNAVRESAKKSTKYAVNVFEGEEVTSRISNLVLRKLRINTLCLLTVK